MLEHYALDTLGADKIQTAPKMFLNYELSQALKDESNAKLFSEVVQFAQEMRTKAETQPVAQKRGHIG